VVDHLRREYGLTYLSLARHSNEHFFADLQGFVIKEASTERILDVIEMVWIV
jgi:hypothetical protein